jgi:hypothetical protein
MPIASGGNMATGLARGGTGTGFACGRTGGAVTNLGWGEAFGQLPNGPRSRGSTVEQPFGGQPAPDRVGVAETHITIAAEKIRPRPRYFFITNSSTIDRSIRASGS